MECLTEYYTPEITLVNQSLYNSTNNPWTSCLPDY
jgi:hypothetical protein